MPVTTRARVLGCPVDVVDMGAAVQRLVDLCEAPAPAQPAVVVTLNPEILMRARREPDFQALLESAALIVPDGIGLVRALHRRGYRNAVRVGGADLLEAYLPHARRLGHRVALVGAGHGVADRAARVLEHAFPGVDVVADGGDPTAHTYPWGNTPVPGGWNTAFPMKQVGYGKGYQYAHDLDEKVADMECMPDNLRGREYYHPTSEGREKLLAQRMEEIKQRKEELRRNEESSPGKKAKPAKRRGDQEQEKD